MIAQSVTRIAGSGTTVYQCCTWSQSVQEDCQLRVVVQELEQDSNEVVTPRPEPQHVDTSKTKAQIWAKGTTERASLLFKKDDICGR